MYIFLFLVRDFCQGNLLKALVFFCLWVVLLLLDTFFRCLKVGEKNKQNIKQLNETLILLAKKGFTIKGFNPGNSIVLNSRFLGN